VPIFISVGEQMSPFMGKLTKADQKQQQQFDGEQALTDCYYFYNSTCKKVRIWD
jgi:hypothetical protein